MRHPKGTSSNYGKIPKRELVPQQEWPPEVDACTEKEKRFLLELIATGGDKYAAVIAAGHDVRSVASGIATASNVLHRPHVRAAQLALAQVSLRNLAPKAVSRLNDILDNPTHRDHLKSIRTVLERTDAVVVKSEGHVTHEIIDRRKEDLDQLKTLKNLGVPREKLEELFGYSGLPLLEAQLHAEPIDAEFTVVEDHVRENERSRQQADDPDKDLGL